MNKEQILISVKEYAQREDISTQSVYKRIKKGKLKSLKKDNQTYILLEKNENRLQISNNQVESNISPNKSDLSNELPTKETFNLQLQTTKLQTEIQAKNREIEILKEKYEKILEVKDDLVASKSETIQSQKKTIQALEITYTQLEIKYQNQAKQLNQQQEQTNKSKQEEKIIIETQEIKNPSPPKSSKTENTKIELMEFLQTQGITDPKQKNQIRARFNRKIGKDTSISKNKKGKIYLDKNQNYTKILNP